jgi:hypothetical protein
MKVGRLALYDRLSAVAVASTAYAFALTGGNFAVLVPFQAMVLLLPGLSLLTPGHKNFDNKNLLRWATISAAVLLTVLANIDAYPVSGTSVEFAVTHAIGIVGILFALQWAATSLSPEALLRHLAICLLPLILLAIAIALRDGGWLLRASPFGVHPNWWGELGFAAVVSALALRRPGMKALVIGTVLILFFLVQSRGALLAACVSVAIYMFLSAKHTQITRRHFMGGLIFLMLAVAGLILGRSAVPRIWELFSDTILLLSDPDRGLETGLTGRLAGWTSAIEIAASNPILGLGLDTLNYVHNGFLQLIGEGGTLLLLVILLTIAAAIYDASRNRNYLALSVILGYLAYAMTYPRMLNMNVASIVFYLCLFSWRRTSKPRGADQRRIDGALMRILPDGLSDVRVQPRLISRAIE